MAIRNTGLGGTDFSSEKLLSVDLNDTFDAASDKIDLNIPKFYSHGGGSSSSSTETDVASITIAQNDLNANTTIVINAGVQGSIGSSGGTSTYRLYVGGVLKDTITFGSQSNTANGSAFAVISTGIDTTVSSTIVKITVAQTANYTLTCTGLTVVGYRI